MKLRLSTVLGLLLLLAARARAEPEGRQLHPVPRYGHSVAFDSARGKAVMFGGGVSLTSSSGTYNGETWEWNGTAWTAFPISGPSARGERAMAYDAARRTTVLFGGKLGPPLGRSDQTWARATDCYPDCTIDGARTVADFGCFQTKFVAADPYADCNGDGARTVADFGCFQTRFVTGCP